MDTQEEQRLRREIKNWCVDYIQKYYNQKGNVPAESIDRGIGLLEIYKNASVSFEKPECGETQRESCWRSYAKLLILLCGMPAQTDHKDKPHSSTHP